MAFFGKTSSVSGMSAQGGTEELQTHLAMAISGGLPVLSALLPGTGFENPPPLAISFKPFQFLKCLGLKSVGLGLESVPFHSGWALVEWKPELSVLESNYAEIFEICEEIGEKNALRFLDLKLN